MLQAAGLATLLLSGFTFAELQRKASSETGVRDFLNQLDVLIDGQYREDLNDQRGLRGSSNQRVHFLTGRYERLKSEFECGQRQVEMHLLKNELLMVGVPTAKSLETFHSLAVNLRSR